MSRGLVERVGRACEARGLLAQGPLAVAVSGGVDSMVLMHILVELGQRPVVVTLDHGIRPESAEEVRSVAREAAALGLRCVQGRLEVAPGPDLAARARAARYAFLDARPEPTIALAHHRDDQAETVLDRLARGAGAGGLAGMAWRRGSYVRPLLEEPRAALEAWARGRGVRWVEDPSNVKGARGALRYTVLPALEAVRPGAAACVARSAALLAEDEALLRSLAGALLAADGVDLARFREAPDPLRRRALLGLVLRTRGERDGIASAQIQAALGLTRPGAALDLPGGWRLAADAARLRCLPPPPGPARLEVGTWGLWEISSSEVVTVRPPRQGERIGGRRLVDRLRAAGVPPSLRPYQPVIELTDALWVPGVVSESGKKGGSGRVVVRRQASPSWSARGPFALER